MLDAFTTYDSFFSKSSYIVLCGLHYLKLPFKIGNCDKHHLIISPSCVSHILPSEDLIDFSLYVWPLPVSNKMTKL